MADEDDLPDHDYESIYGREALHARQDARLRHLWEQSERMAHMMAALNQRLREADTEHS